MEEDGGETENFMFKDSVVKRSYSYHPYVARTFKALTLHSKILQVDF